MIQRYNHLQHHPDYDDCEFYNDDAGEYVLFSDHQQALAAAEGRVKVLEEAASKLLSAKDETEFTYEDAYALLKHGPWKELRAALRGEAPGEEG